MIDDWLKEAGNCGELAQLHYIDPQAIRRQIPQKLPGLQAQAKRVLGVQGNMWGETTSSLQKVDARTFPRLCALAETGWTGRDDRDFADFSARLADFRQRLEIMGVAGGKF